MLWKNKSVSSEDKKIIKRKYLEKWHPIFAWLPHVIETDSEGNQTKAWLQWIERKGIYRNGLGIVRNWWDWEYRAMVPEQRMEKDDVDVFLDECNKAYVEDNLPFFG